MHATEEEQAAIREMLIRRAESAPAGAGAGRASALAWAGFKVAAMVLLVAGVAVGLGDGNEFDDVGCSVAQQPGGASHGGRSAQAGERGGGKVPGSDGGTAGGSGDGRSAGGPECEVRAETCPHRMPDGQCQGSNRQCRYVAGAVPGRAGALSAAIEGDAATGHFRIHVAPTNEEGWPPPRQPAEPDEGSLGIAAKVFELLSALDPGKRLRKAPPIRVFNLYYRQRLEPAEIARRCKCHRSLVFDRLAAIQNALPWTPRQLHELSPQVEALEQALSDSWASHICRKRAVCGEVRDEGESG